MPAAARRATVRSERETQLLEPQAQSPVGRDCTTFEFEVRWAATGACHFNGLGRCHRVVHVRRDVADGYRMGCGVIRLCDPDRAPFRHCCPSIPASERFVSVCAAARSRGRAIAVGRLTSSPLPDPIRLCQRPHSIACPISASCRVWTARMAV